jgi:hypothetical protein
MLKWVEGTMVRVVLPQLGPSAGVTKLGGSNPSFEGLGTVISARRGRPEGKKRVGPFVRA